MASKLVLKWKFSLQQLTIIVVWNELHAQMYYPAIAAFVTN
jgi:hypothetical protein